MPVPGPRPRPQNGKGDDQRPLSVDPETFAENWARIFGKPKPRTEPCPQLAQVAPNARGVRPCGQPMRCPDHGAAQTGE